LDPQHDSFPVGTLLKEGRATDRDPLLNPAQVPATGSVPAVDMIKVRAHDGLAVGSVTNCLGGMGGDHRGADLLAGGGVPLANDPEASRQQPFAVGTECHAADFVAMVKGRPDRLGGGGVVLLSRIAFVDEHGLAVGAEWQRLVAPALAAQGLADQLARG